MGWYFSNQSRSELIAELIATQETERASVRSSLTPCAATCCGPSPK